MTIRHHQHARSPIGLDIGERAIKAAQVSGAGTALRLESSAVLARLEPGGTPAAEEVRRLREVLERRGFVGRRVVVAVPNDAAMLSLVDLPPRDSGAPLATIAAAELARAHRCDPAELEVACWDVPPPARPSSGAPAMAAGCRRARAEALLTTLERDGGLDVIGLDLQGWALARACAPVLPDHGEVVAIVNLGWQYATLVLLHQRTVVYERHLGGAGLAPLYETLQRDHRLDPQVIDHLLATLGFDNPSDGDDPATGLPEEAALATKLRTPLATHAEQLMQELSLSLTYASHQYPDAPVRQLLLVGGGAGIRGLGAQLAEPLDVEVTVLAPQRVCDCAQAAPDEASAAALIVALGLAQYPKEAAA